MVYVYLTKILSILLKGYSMKEQIKYDRAVELLSQIEFFNFKTQKIFITQSLGYVLAKDIIAFENSPKLPTSAMDGYAIKGEKQDKNSLCIIDFNPAGSVVQNSVGEGECIKTFTGSLMPDGADTLIPIENVRVEDNMIFITQKVPTGFAVRSVGENYKKDEILIPKGSVIGFAEIGVMASLNIVFVEVYEKPTVAICSTGSEILDLGEMQTNDAQIRSSNHLTIEALSIKYGANTKQLGLVKDDRQSILEAIQNGLNCADIVVTTGGVSVGDYDFVKDIVVEQLGATVLFQGVNIKPGQHVIVARVKDKFIASLPGFAYSSTVTFILFVVPLIFKLRGSSQSLQLVQAILEHDLPKKVSKTVFSACNICYKNGQYFVNTHGKKEGSSGILTNMLGASALIVQSQDECGSKCGDSVDVILL